MTEINDYFLDILVEIPAYKPRNLNYSIPLSETILANSRLFKIGTEFSKCIDRNTNPEECSRSRIHYIDVRNIEERKRYWIRCSFYFYKLLVFNIIHNYDDLNEKRKFIKLFIYKYGNSIQKFVKNL